MSSTKFNLAMALGSAVLFIVSFFSDASAFAFMLLLLGALVYCMVESWIGEDVVGIIGVGVGIFAYLYANGEISVPWVLAIALTIAGLVWVGQGMQYEFDDAVTSLAFFGAAAAVLVVGLVFGWTQLLIIVSCAASVCWHLFCATDEY